MRVAPANASELAVIAQVALLAVFVWGLSIRGGGKDKRLEGPVRLVPVKPDAPVGPETRIYPTPPLLMLELHGEVASPEWPG
jgi:hypothetical protein